MRVTRMLGLLLLACTCSTADAQEKKPAVPSWNARGVGPLPRMGITSIDVSDDGKEIVVGTIAAFGDPNVIVLDDTGKIVRTYKVGQQWIDNVGFLPGSKDVFAICTMPAGRVGDRVELFRCQGEQVLAEKTKQEGPWYFHYGDHSNHATMKLARARNATAVLAGNQLVVYRKDKEPATLRIPVSDPDASVSLAIDEHGWAVVGTTSRESKAAAGNLFLFDPDKQKPVWSRAVNKDVDKAPALEKGLYGTPTLPDGTRAELPQRDEKVWAPLSVAIHSSDEGRVIAVADYQGWQRWVRSSATMKDEYQGLRFAPAKPTITVYNSTGKTWQRFAADKFDQPQWFDMRFQTDGSIVLWPHHWKSRGLAGQALLPSDRQIQTVITLDPGIPPNGFIQRKKIDEGVVDIAVIPRGGRYGTWNDGIPSLVCTHPDGKRLVVAETHGVVRLEDFFPGKVSWKIDLNTAVPKALKPWVANARATPIVDGVWQIPGGRVESDLGGQRVIEAPDGLILIEGHAGLSFEREWAAMVAVGLDPMKVKYVLATHEHGDHAPGAYLWRVVTGAKFVCSEEMAYTLQHHIPGNTGYGLHPPVPTDIVIKKDTELDLAGLKVRAIRIPGHTYGSMAWHFEKSGSKFVAFGDLIMPRGVLGYSGSVNFSARDVLSSLQKLRDLKVDYVLPGHGAVEGPANYFHAGIDVGQAVGWGFIKPERPDPRFRITQKNVLVAGWGQQATSAAFGDVNSDGRPDVVIVSPDGEGSIVKFFLNHDGKFNDQPDHEIKVATVSQPHKIRVTNDGPGRAHVMVAGKTAALLVPDFPLVKGKLPKYDILPFDLGDGNHLRWLNVGGTEQFSPLVSRRFGGFYVVESANGKWSARKFEAEIDGPYVDFQRIGNDFVTSYGRIFRRGQDPKFSSTPIAQLPRDKDWQFLALGDFNGDGKPDAAFLSYGMDQSTAARVFHGRSKTKADFGDKADLVLPLSALLTSAKKNQTFPLVRDTPVVADWNGDGIDDLIVAHGQSDEVLVFLGGKDGLSKERVQRIQLEYRVHYEHGVHVADFNGDGKADLAVFGYTNTGVGSGGPPAVYIWLQ